MTLFSSSPINQFGSFCPVAPPLVLAIPVAAVRRKKTANGSHSRARGNPEFSSWVPVFTRMTCEDNLSSKVLVVHHLRWDLDYAPYPTQFTH